MDIRPKCWTPERIAAPVYYSYTDEYIGEFMKHDIVKCPGDVLVTNGKGDRFWDLRRLTKHLKLKPAVLKGIKSRLKDFDYNSVVVHLRGTDRPDATGTFTEKSIEAVKRTGVPLNQVYVITDQRDLWEKFKAGIPEARLVNPNSNILKIPPTNERGTHQQDPVELKKLGIKKWDMMLDLMADWVALVSCATAIGRSESTYFSMARGLHNLGQDKWSQMFRGWVPTSKTLQELQNDPQRTSPEGTGSE